MPGVADDVEQPGLGSMLRRALGLRGPGCGSGRLFQRWFDLVERCPRCRLRFERGEGEFIGAVGVNTVITLGVILAITVASAVAIVQGGDTWPWVTGAVTVALILPMVFFRFSRTIWVAISLAMDPLEDGEVVATEGP